MQPFVPLSLLSRWAMLACSNSCCPQGAGRYGVDSSLVSSGNWEPATRLLQVRAHLATHVGSPRSPELVASSRATSNTGVAGSTSSMELRENRLAADRSRSEPVRFPKTGVDTASRKWFCNNVSGPQGQARSVLGTEGIITRRPTTQPGESSRPQGRGRLICVDQGTGTVRVMGAGCPR
jgi:hypothetical protein